MSQPTRTSSSANRPRKTQLERRPGPTRERSVGSVRDGRMERTERSRAKIVAALLNLVTSSTSHPTASEIAMQAGVSRRTLFRHFVDLDSLARAALASQHLDIDERYAPPLETDESLEIVVAKLIHYLVNVNEAMTPIRRLVQKSVGSHQGITEDLALARLQRLQRIELLLRRFLPKAHDDRELRVRALGALSDWTLWHSLRSDQDLDTDEAQQVLEFLAYRTIDPTGRLPRPPRRKRNQRAEMPVPKLPDGEN